MTNRIDDNRTLRPALSTLLHNQAALFDPSVATGNRAIEHGFRDGFPDRRALITWYQRAQTRCLGYLAETWPPSALFADDVLLAATIRDPVVNDLPDLEVVEQSEFLERALRESSLLVEPMDEEMARRYRRLVEAHLIQPACQRAYQYLRGRAGEYTPTNDEDEEDALLIAPEEQAHVAMRPALQELDDKQARSLAQLWGGFDEFDRLLDWLHSLAEPANGELPSEFASRVVDDPVALRHLHHQPGTNAARLYRELWAAGVLLPVFVDGVQELSAGEVASPGEPTDHSAMPFKS